MSSSARITVVVGVDGSGRTRRLTRLGTAAPAARLVDDAHLLDDPTLTELAAAARRGEPMIAARRPALDRAALADLDAALAAHGEAEHLAPLDLDGVARLLENRGSAEDPAAALADTGGLPALVATSPDALTDRVRRKLAGLPAETAVARVLALGLRLDDAALAAATGIAEPADALAGLRAAGLLDAAEHMPPAVARAVTATLGPAAVRRALDAAAAALLARGRAADLQPAAEQLRQQGIRSVAAAAIYRAAGEHALAGDPAAAAAWFDEALDAGEDPALVAAGRAEAAALLGRAVPDTPAGAAAGTRRVAVARAAAAARQGRPGRAAETLGDRDPAGTLARVSAGLPAGPLPEHGRSLAAGAAAAPADPVAALPLLVEAVEEFVPGGGPLLDTPHAVAALTAVAAGDSGTAERVLLQAIRVEAGGPAFADRHRLLLAWSRLRAGRYDTAAAECGRSAEPLGGRDRLVLAALRTGLARRAGDVAALREAWSAAEEQLARQAVDLFAVEVVEELAVTAGRLRQAHRAQPLLDAIDTALARLGDPPAWTTAAAWTRLQLAVGTDDADAVAAAADRLRTVAAPGIRGRALHAGGRLWARVMAGEVDAVAVSETAEALAEAQLPWEGSRLAGQAAIRTTDATAARRLLERARELSGAEPAPAPATGETPLSDREIEVSRLVLAGRTHREIGAQLFIAPKTVEHHVARIRAKLGAGTRAEFVAALHQTLG